MVKKTQRDVLIRLEIITICVCILLVNSCTVRKINPTKVYKNKYIEAITNKDRKELTKLLEEL